MCHQKNEVEFETISFSFFVWFLTSFHLWLHENDVEGTCGDHCDELCDHQPCLLDFELDVRSCRCVDNAPSLCGANAQCVTPDVCECLPGFQGSPSVGCAAIDIPVPSQPPTTLLEPIPGVIAVGINPELTVIACGPNTVTVAGSLAGSFAPGDNLVYIRDNNQCGDCSPLYRKIVTVSGDPASDVKSFITEFSRIGDVAPQLFTEDVADIEVEPQFACAHSGVQDNPEGRGLNEAERLLQSNRANCASDWLLKDSEGKCRYTDCYVGPRGSADLCFECRSTCFNGCGSGKFGFSGQIPLVVDFGPACCYHDYCWSSTLGKGPVTRIFLI